MTDLSPESWVVSGGRTRVPGDPLNTPPVLASNYYLTTDRVYARGESTPTVDVLEELVGELEEGKALAFSSGMAAVAVVLNRLPVGSVLAIPTDPYQAVKGLATEGEAQGRWKVKRLDLSDTEAWVKAAATSDLLWLESPSNPLLTVADLPTICAAPRKPECVVAVDSTFATPLVQKPLGLGADIVMHSATKFLGGHSDLLGGVVVTRDDLHDEFYERRRISGATIGAMEAFLATRGIRTLALRMAKAQANAMTLAQRLEAHSEIAKVHYPGLESHGTHDNAVKFMEGFGAMMSFETTGPGERASAVCEAARLINHATSLGGVESTMERRSVLPGQETMPPTLIRLSVGCENAEELWSDLDRALTVTA